MTRTSREPLECPPDMAADFVQTEQSKKEGKEEAEVPFMTHSSKLPADTSASLYSLKMSHQVQHTQEEGKYVPPFERRSTKKLWPIA